MRRPSNGRARSSNSCTIKSLTLPPGALKMRWISNHDTVSWTFQKQRPALAYGVERMRALLALCALIEGVPMLYQGDEDPAVYGGQGESSVEFLAQLYGLRKRLDALREGTADYRSSSATGGVFACLRQGSRAGAGADQFQSDAVETEVSLPPEVTGLVQDVFSGQRSERDRAPAHRDGSLSDACADSRVMFEPARGQVRQT